jgi:hypothetical protein
LRVLVDPTRKEPGNLRYDLFVRVDGVVAFQMFEVTDWLAAPLEIRVSHPVDVAPFQ